MRWIIELHRVLPEQWVTLQQVYQCAIDPDLFRSQDQTGREVERRAKQRRGVSFRWRSVERSGTVDIGEWPWTDDAVGNGKEMRAKWSAGIRAETKGLSDPSLVSFGNLDPAMM